jgi:hypothetical protein
MKSHLCVGAMLFFLAVGTLLAQTAREQAPDRPADSNAAPEESTRDSDSSAAGTDPGLDGKAMEAVRSWKFEPATKDGKPVAVHLQVEVQFRLY